MIHVLAALLLAALLAAPAHAQTPGGLDRARELNAEIVKLYGQGRFGDAIPLAREALALREAALGPDDLDVAQSLNNLAQLLLATGDYAGARPLAERVLRINEQALGAAHPAVATSLANLVAIVHATGDYAGAQPLAERAVRIGETALGPEHPNVGILLNNLVEVLRALGDYAAARPLSERALRITEAASGPEHPDVGIRLNNLASLLETTGDYTAAQPLYERALRIIEKARGPNDPMVGRALNNLAKLAHERGDYRAARPMYERALRITEAAMGPDHPDVGVRLSNLGLLLREMGEYVPARQMSERALAITEAALGPAHPDVAIRLSNLAGLLREMGDAAAAWSLYERALAITERALGPTHADVALRLNNLASAYRDLKDDATARRLYERALAITEQTLGASHPMVARSAGNLATMVQATGDHAGARRLYERALAITEAALGPNHPDVTIHLNNLGVLLADSGDVTPARAHFERALAINEAAFGASHPDVASNLTSLAQVREAAGDYAGARAAYERARRIDEASGATNAALDDEARRGLQRTTRTASASYVALLAAIARDPARDPGATAPAEHAFLVAEQARGRAAQSALARAAARTAAGNATTAGLARQLQDLSGRREGIRKQIVAEYGRPADRRDPARLTALRGQAGELERDVETTAQKLRAVFPKYDTLATPSPIDTAATRRLLRSDEALLSIFPLPDRVLIWLVRPRRATVYRDVPVPYEDLRALVSRVRASLDQSENTDAESGRLAPFDVAGAHALYRLLLAPVAGELAGVRHLVIVPASVLVALPFGALVTSAEGEAYRTLDYAKVAWLARDFAISVLPSATSLRALRQVRWARAAAAEPFIGFGDPVLRGSAARRGGAMVVTRGASVLDELRNLDALPGTRDELQAVGRALGADVGRAVFLGPRATKPEVFALDASGRLGRARVLAFATHGLLAGEIAGLRQPALVLTPPAQVQPEDDGLLSLDDVVNLKLTSTSWVILSACNTGAGDDTGEGLSGLARAFFFAGAPALLVSHWSVDDRATQALMTEIFRRMAARPGLARAEALRQGMLALMRGARGPTAYFAHPFAWAPFFLVGEGR